MILLDASALVSFFVADANSDAVNAYFSEAKPVAGVSDFAAAEFASAVSLRLRRKQIALPEAMEILNIFDEWTARNARMIPLAPVDFPTATAFVRRFELGLRAPDAIHLAVSHRLGSPLLTFDIRQARAARVLGISLALPHAQQN